MNRRTFFSIVMGMLLSFIGLYLAFRNVPLRELYHYLKSIDFLWMIPAVAVVLLTYVIRALRWQIILSASHQITFKEAFHPLIIGFMMNCILPARIGEIARPAILKNKSRVPFSTGIATVVADRFFDILLLLGLFSWIMATFDFQSAREMSFGHYRLNSAILKSLGDKLTFLSLFMVAGILFVSLNFSRNLLVKGISALPNRMFFLGHRRKSLLRDKIIQPIINILENISSGFSLLRHPKKMIFCTALSALIWGFQAFSYFLVARGCPGISLSFVDILTVMIIVCIFIALPSVPGYWGIWEAGGVFALGLFGIDAKEAVGFTLTNHAIQVLPVILIGLASAVIISVNIRQFSGGQPLRAVNQIDGKDGST
jgi:glycosyltransferase 2 family protein